MPSFLDLPRELRDQIYEYVLISPQGFVEATEPPPRKIIKSSSTKPRLRLCNNPNWELRDPSEPREYTSLSLPQTCRQIYAETKGIFWAKNTFYFPTFEGDKQTPGVVTMLKMMGQTASRLITSVHIVMPPITPRYLSFGKVLKTLGSRARHGELRKLELVWGIREWEDLVMMEMGLTRLAIAASDAYAQFLDALRISSEACKYERIIRVPDKAFLFMNEYPEKEHEDIMEALHFCCGGKLYMGNTLMYENFQQVRKWTV